MMFIKSIIYLCNCDCVNTHQHVLKPGRICVAACGQCKLCPNYTNTMADYCCSGCSLKNHIYCGQPEKQL